MMQDSLFMLHQNLVTKKLPTPDGVNPDGRTHPYNLLLLDNREIIQEYEWHILPKLTLGGANNSPSEREQLRHENAELKEQLLQLTNTLTERLTSSQ